MNGSGFYDKFKNLDMAVLKYKMKRRKIYRKLKFTYDRNEEHPNFVGKFVYDMSSVLSAMSADTALTLLQLPAL